jgi:thiol-disulfide isomerase/thioredoxin
MNGLQLKKQHQSKLLTSTLVIAAGLALGASLGIGLDNSMGPAIEREGDLEHRQLTLELESKQFDIELLAGLDGWSLDQPLTSESIKDQVVMIAFVSINEKKSMTMLSSLARYQRQNEAKGLQVLVVHPESGWDKMSEKIEGGRVKVQVARDVGGAMGEALHVDGYPDVYMVDRNGQLRYADIESKSLRFAVTGLVRESAEDAMDSSTREQIEQSRMVRRAKADQPREVSDEDYLNAAWPEHNKGKLNAEDYQGKMLPVALGNEQWLTERRDTTDKVVVLDFWATWCPPCRTAMPILDQLQKSHNGKIEVLAMGGQSDDLSKVRSYISGSLHTYSHLYDQNQTIYRQLKVSAIPHAVILSSDGVIRWQGNPLSSEFVPALEKVIEVDPMVASES